MKIYAYNGQSNICGKRIYEARKKNHITQSQLAARLKIAGVCIERDSISKIESGRRFVADYEIVAFSRALDVSVIWLLGIANNQQDEH